MYENSNSEIMLLFRGTDWHKNMSPEEMQAAAGRFMAWFERLKAEGKAKAGQPLQNVGRVISKNGRTSGSISQSIFLTSKFDFATPRIFRVPTSSAPSR